MSDLRLPEKFEGPRVKIKRAAHHLNEIEELVTKYRALNPHVTVYQLNADKTFHEGRVVERVQPFEEFGGVIGEFLYQLRSSLDNIVYELSVPNFPNTVPERQKAESVPEFTLLFDDPGQPHDHWRLKFVPPVVKQLVGRYQPYRHRDSHPPYPLAVLEALGVRDKHRIVQPVATDIAVRVRDTLPGVYSKMTSRANYREVLVYVPAEFDPIHDLDPLVSYSLSLRVPDVGIGTVDLSFLHRIYQLVANDVLPSFENLIAQGQPRP